MVAVGQEQVAHKGLAKSVSVCTESTGMFFDHYDVINLYFKWLSRCASVLTKSDSRSLKSMDLYERD